MNNIRILNNMRNKMRTPYLSRIVNNVRRNENFHDKQKENVKEHIENFNDTFAKAKKPTSTKIWVEKKENDTSKK